MSPFLMGKAQLRNKGLARIFAKGTFVLARDRREEKTPRREKDPSDEPEGRGAPREEDAEEEEEDEEL